MDWTNDMVLEFLQVFSTESVIWDPKHPEHKKKQSLADAWRRINNTLNWQCSVEDLKKKKDSLMAYYRIHLNKIRKLKTTGTGAEDDYRTNWFAFDTMNNFLGNIYDCTVSYNSEDIGNERNRLILDSTDSANGSEYLSDSEYPSKRKRREVHEILVEETKSSTEKGKTESEMYALLLVHKLIKLEEDDRLILMNKIDNLVFQTTMASNAKMKFKPNKSNQILRNNTDSSSCQTSFCDIPSPPHQQQSPQRLSTENYIILPTSSSSHSPSIAGNNSQCISSIQNTEIKKEA